MGFGIYFRENADVELCFSLNTCGWCVLWPLYVLTVPCKKGMGPTAHLSRHSETQAGQGCEGVSAIAYLRGERVTVRLTLHHYGFLCSEICYASCFLLHKLELCPLLSAPHTHTYHPFYNCFPIPFSPYGSILLYFLATI